MTHITGNLKHSSKWKRIKRQRNYRIEADKQSFNKYGRKNNRKKAVLRGVNFTFVERGKINNYFLDAFELTDISRKTNKGESFYVGDEDDRVEIILTKNIKV
jgi:hypothetical protein